MTIPRKNYFINIIAVVLLIVVLCISGRECIDGISTAELKKSSYTRTLFDMHIAKPSKAQVEDIESDASVDAVFPYYSYEFSSNKAVSLLISDDIGDSDISVLTQGTILEGDPHDKSGAMLDKRAADALGVTVGDVITFRIMGETFTEKVSSIHLPTQIPLFDDGVIIIDMSDGVASLIPERAYSGAFVRSNDIAATEKLLADYIGEGNVNLTYEEYSENIFKFPEQTQEEYEEICRKKYEEYRADVLASVGKVGQVTRKSEAYTIVKSKVETLEQWVEERKIFTFCFVFILLLIAIFVSMLCNSKTDKKIRDDYGVKIGEMTASYVLASLITAIVIAGVTAAILSFLASRTYFPDECRDIVIAFSSSALIAVVPSLLINFIMVKRLYIIKAADRGGKNG